MYGHSDWEYVDKKLLKRFDDEHYEVILFHYEDTRNEDTRKIQERKNNGIL